jgi:tetratricopeptide (TPR) repeat protein
VAARPELPAHHYTAAGLAARAIPWWLLAGQQALAQSANWEAIRNVEQGLDLLAAIPDTPARAGQELGLRLALSSALLANQGYAAKRVGATLERARELCDALGDSRQVFPVLWGLGAFYTVRAELGTALQLSTRVRTIAEATGEPALLVLAYLSYAGSFMWGGRLQAARDSFERALSFYQPAEHAALAAAYSYDPGTAAQAYLGMTLWFLGYPDQARERTRGAVARTKVMGHAHSYVHSLTRDAQVALLCGDGRAVLESVPPILEISEEKGFPLWHAFGSVLRGHALCLEGQAERGLDDIRTGFQRTMDTGAAVAFPVLSHALIEALVALGRYDEALEAIAHALKHVATNKDELYEAELHRLRGDVRARAGSAAAGSALAEESFLEALAITRRQAARSWQLRASCSLARLWYRQQKPTAAFELLNDSYAGFTEGLQTSDLKLARETLEDLSIHRS